MAVIQTFKKQWPQPRGTALFCRHTLKKILQMTDHPILPHSALPSRAASHDDGRDRNLPQLTQNNGHALTTDDRKLRPIRGPQDYLKERNS